MFVESNGKSKVFKELLIEKYIIIKINTGAISNML